MNLSQIKKQNNLNIKYFMLNFSYTLDVMWYGLDEHQRQTGA